MPTELEMFSDLHSVFLDVARKIIAECPESPVRVEVVQHLLDAQIAANHAYRWRPE